MWHEFRCLRQQPPLPLFQPLVEKRRKSSRGGLTQESGVFWTQSSKELPAAYINHPQLAQRGNSICRERRCILFIEELLVIGHILHLSQRARRHGRRPQCASFTKK